MATRTTTSKPRIIELYRLNDFHETLQKSYFDAAKWYFKKYGNEAVKVTKVRTGDVRVIRRKSQIAAA